MKKIYLIERTDDCDWDEYDGVVVVALSAKDAKKHVFVLKFWGMNKDNCTCTKIGVANKRLALGTVLSSFNAG
jgi:hypothetical protein